MNRKRIKKKQIIRRASSKSQAFDSSTHDKLSIPLHTGHRQWWEQCVCVRVVVVVAVAGARLPCDRLICNGAQPVGYRAKRKVRQRNELVCWIAGGNEHCTYSITESIRAKHDNWQLERWLENEIDAGARVPRKYTHTHTLHILSTHSHKCIRRTYFKSGKCLCTQTRQPCTQRSHSTIRFCAHYYYSCHSVYDVCVCVRREGTLSRGEMPIKCTYRGTDKWQYYRFTYVFGRIEP